MKERLESLDILRGADMFLLLFLGPVLRAVAKVFGLVSLNGQLSHVEWEGFATWDIIMPLFLFLSGITVPFSLFGAKSLTSFFSKVMYLSTPALLAFAIASSRQRESISEP